MVAPHDEVRATVVLPEDRVQQRLARPGVAHLHRVATLHDAVFAEVLVHQRVDRAHAHLGRDVARFQLADKLVNVHAVADLDRHPGKVSVRVVHRIAELERGHRFPSAFFKDPARLGRPLVDAGEHLRVVGLRQHTHRAGQVDRPLLHHLLDAGMRRVGGAEDLAAFVVLVDRVLLLDAHRAHHGLCFRVIQRHLFSGPDRIRQILGGGQSDGDRPEESLPRRQGIRVAAAAPVVVAHEAFKGRERADAHHDEVARLPRRHGDPLQASRSLDLVQPFLAFDQQRLQLGRTVGWYQSAHQSP